MKPYLWVLRDLSNGDGAEGIPFPKYIWVFRLREDARFHAYLHRRDPARKAKLGPVEKWPRPTVANLYDWSTDNYYTRKRRRRGFTY